MFIILFKLFLIITQNLTFLHSVKSIFLNFKFKTFINDFTIYFIGFKISFINSKVLREFVFNFIVNLFYFQLCFNFTLILIV